MLMIYYKSQTVIWNCHLQRKEKWFFYSLSPISVNQSNICFDLFGNPKALSSLCFFPNRLPCEDSSLLICVRTPRFAVPWCSWWIWLGWWSWPPHWSALVSPPAVRACVGGFKVTAVTSDPTSYSSWLMTRMWSWVSIPYAIHHYWPICSADEWGGDLIRLSWGFVSTRQASVMNQQVVWKVTVEISKNHNDTWRIMGMKL